MLTPSLLYLAAAGLLWRGLAQGDGGRPSLRAGFVTAGVAIALHLALLIQMAIAARGIDLHFFAALSIVSAGVALLCALLTSARPQVAALGLVVYPLAALCQAAYAWSAGRGAGAIALSWQIQLHAWLALLAYATLSLAALLAIMLWLQERFLRRRQLATALHAFPPLTLVETLLFRLIAGGYALLTLALLTGVVFVEDLFAQHLAHKTALSLLAWLAFGALLLGRARYGWRGRRAVRLTLTAMALLGLAFFGSKFVLELVLQRTA